MLALPSNYDRTLTVFAIAAFLIGALLRLSYPGDIEYKQDERWMFEKTQSVGVSEAWPAVGMPSSQGVANPGLSVWLFIGLKRVFRAENPIQLARAVQIIDVLAILALFIFIAVAIPQKEKVGWLWGAALICVSPLSVLLHRKIWAQSVLPPLMMIFLIGWWYRRKHWSGALVWGLAGALLGQVHMAGFYLALAVWAWTILFDSGRNTISWVAWGGGSLLGALGALPWLLQLSKSFGGGFSFYMSAWINFKWWNYWISNSTGIIMEYSLGEHFWSFLAYPLIGQRPTYLVGTAHAVLGLCALYVLRLAIRRLSENRGRWFALFTGRASQSSLVINSYFWGCGILMTALGVAIQRHYLLVAFPLAHVWFARFLANDARWGSRVFGLIWSAQLLVTLLFLYYIHVNGGAANGDYGVAYSVAHSR